MEKNKFEASIKAGKILAEVRDIVLAAVNPGISFEELEAIAQREIKKRGAKPSFTTVADYQWATCITKNEGCCHGIPREKKVAKGDLITVDVGVLYEGFHSDTAATVCAGSCTKEQEEFLLAGKEALQNAIQQAQPGNSIYDISKAMQDTIESSGYSVVYQLTGHGIGRKLHEPPNIPCFADEKNKKYVLKADKMIAIEIMYAKGKPSLVLDEDGWTYSTEDGSWTGMFEHTVLITEHGPEVLTLSPLENRAKI